jgi:hypothetical protein
MRLFQQAIDGIKELHPAPCQMRLNVNRQNKAVDFYRHMGMYKLAEGDFPIGQGYYMNDYIMALDIEKQPFPWDSPNIHSLLSPCDNSLYNNAFL